MPANSRWDLIRRLRVKDVRPRKTSDSCFKHKLSTVWMVQTAKVSLYLCFIERHELEMCEGLKIWLGIRWRCMVNFMPRQGARAPGTH